MANRTPSLQEVMGAHFDYQAGMHTALPGIVVSVGNLAEQRIDVQPTPNMRDPSGEGKQSKKRPSYSKFPLHMPVTKEGGLTYPISVGTPVFLIFFYERMDVWKRGNGYSVTPSDYRKLILRIVLLFPESTHFLKLQIPLLNVSMGTVLMMLC